MLSFNTSKCMILVFFTLLFFKCENTKTTSKNLGMKKENISIQLSTNTETIILSKLKNFEISISGTNHGNRVVNPEFQMTDLYVNGVKSMTWMLAIGNGIREAKWYSLPPNETTSMSWSTMGEQLFLVPGDYTLQLRLRNIKSNSIKITVLKD